MSAFGLPILPTKLRFVEEIQVSPSASKPECTATQTPQVGGRITAPASNRIPRIPSALACFQMERELGDTSNLTFLATLRPFSRRAAARRSSYLPPVHEPRYAWSMSTPCTSETALTLSTS